MTFKESMKAEWRRLNPRYVQPGDNLRQIAVHAYQETLPGYFAPLRMAWWLIKRGCLALFRWRKA